MKDPIAGLSSLYRLTRLMDSFGRDDIFRFQNGQMTLESEGSRVRRVLGSPHRLSSELHYNSARK